MTCAVDGQVHRVCVRDHLAGLVEGHGRFRATCGRTVLAASLLTVPGRDCWACTAASGSGPSARGRHRRRR